MKISLSIKSNDISKEIKLTEFMLLLSRHLDLASLHRKPNFGLAQEFGRTIRLPVLFNHDILQGYVTFFALRGCLIVDLFQKIKMCCVFL